MQRVFNSQNKRTRPFNHLRNLVDHFNSVFFLDFLPRRPKFDKIVPRFKFETKRDKMRQPRSSKFDEKRFGPKKQQLMCSNFGHDSFEICDQKWSWFWGQIWILFCWENSFNFDFDCLSPKHGWTEFESEWRRNRISIKPNRNSFGTTLQKNVFDANWLGNNKTNWQSWATSTR